ncbi:ankyrin repeats (3 copies) domain-containing protein [Hirsutella rhossiliensis]|uniref:Ankyrin repeats (3 copies) domain-containing protein n=1 Tax=Hirsutella rhossiliensis TaxID=111463 RepID=A0A9P8SIU7_9HYPO|nr:ankyrin repeats (3 copies) domain-containing protein [Hirsutella rhossiliensis]KAH0964578.1 ankyrin repeats (3 copies) domain-containing protein [Hirsutella rhossiliensis]
MRKLVKGLVRNRSKSNRDPCRSDQTEGSGQHLQAQARAEGSPLPAKSIDSNAPAPPLTHGAESDTPTSSPQSSSLPAAHEVPIHELWGWAYEKLRKDDKRLVDQYESKLCEGLDVYPGANKKDLMEEALRRKMEQVDKGLWKFDIRGSEIQIKHLVHSMSKAVNWANAHIGGVLDANWFASIAWAGVSVILLPILQNPPEQAACLAEGIEYVSSLIGRSRMLEDLYTSNHRYEPPNDQQFLSPSSSEYKDSLGELYRQILKFLASSYRYLAKDSASRIYLDVINCNDWDAMVANVRRKEKAFEDAKKIWGNMVFQKAQQKRHQETLDWLDKPVSDAKRREILDWLSNIDPSELNNTKYRELTGLHDIGPVRSIPDTSRWLVKDNDDFRWWKADPRSFLWLHGNAGSGKSVLSSSVITHLLRLNDSAPSTALAYFYFSFSDLKTQNLAAMLASLVKQLYAHRRDTPQLISKFYEYKEKGQRPGLESLEEALMATSNGFSAVYIVLDGLDECPRFNNERKVLLGVLSRIVRTQPDNMHIFCTSRKEEDINAAMTKLSLPPSAAIDLTAHRAAIDSNISAYIDAALESDEYQWDSELKTYARKKLMEKAEGMFQYVSCQLKALQECVSSHQEVRQALENLPDGLDKTYDRMLQNIEPKLKTQVLGVLKWLACSMTPLTIEEVAEIFILRLDKDAILDANERLCRPENVLKYLSSGLVVTVAARFGNVQVRLSHYSVQEYLTCSRISEGPAANFSFTDVDANIHVARSSLAYILQRDISESYSNDFPLVRYAAEFWSAHLENVSREFWPKEVVRAALRAAAVRSQSLLGDELLTRPYRIMALQGFTKTTEMLLANVEYLTQEDLDLTLQDAARHGSKALTKLMLRMGANVDAESRCYGNALLAALHKGHEDVLSLLLDHGANVNGVAVQHGRRRFYQVGDDRRKRSALEIAAERHPDLVRLLLDRGAEITDGVLPAAVQSLECLRLFLDRGVDINKDSGDERGTALHAAAGTGQVEVVRLLLDEGADVNAQGGKYGNALQAACWEGSGPIVELLLARGADVNAVGGHLGSALQAACFLGHGAAPHPIEKSKRRGIIEQLLVKGADVNAQGGQYGNALQAACAAYQAETEVVELLLDRGADVNAQGGYYGNALQAACAIFLSGAEMDRHTMVELLLSKGADVNAQGGHYGNALQAACARFLKTDEQDSDTLVELLLARGADVNARGGLYGSALQAACFKTRSKTKVAQMLLERGSEVNAEGGVHGTALQAAICCDLFPYSVPLLLKHGADVHIRGGAYGSAWHAAVEHYNPELMLQLLHRGVDVNDAGGKYGTALHWALATDTFRAKQSSLNRITFLLDCGADVNLAAGDYGFPLQFMCSFLGDRYLHGTRLRVTKAELVLSSCPNIDIDARGGPFGTALQAAANRGSADLVRLLLENGARVDISGGQYGSALNGAVFGGCWPNVEVLLEAGAVPDCHVRDEVDKELMRRVEVADGRGAVQRYIKFWEVQMEKKRRGLKTTDRLRGHRLGGEEVIKCFDDLAD